MSNYIYAQNIIHLNRTKYIFKIYHSSFHNSRHFPTLYDLRFVH